MFENNDLQRWAMSVKKSMQLADTNFRTISDKIEKNSKDISILFRHIQGVRMEQKNPYEQASKYHAVVMGIGYAGFFALWNFVEKEPHPKLHALAGLLIGLSLFIFVLWEVIQMAINTMAIAAGPPALGNGRTWAAKVQSASSGLVRVWPWVFVPTLLTGFSGAVCLFAILTYKVAAAFFRG